jgi:hypothetical protein
MPFQKRSQFTIHTVRQKFHQWLTWPWRISSTLRRSGTAGNKQQQGTCTLCGIANRKQRPMTESVAQSHSDCPESQHLCS